MAKITPGAADALQAAIGGKVSGRGRPATARPSTSGTTPSRGARRSSRAARAATTSAAARRSRSERVSRSPSAAAGTTIAGFALSDDGLVIDLTPMKAVTVDPGARRAPVRGGATWASSTPPPRSTGSPSRRASSATPASAGSPSAAASAGSSATAGLTIDNLVSRRGRHRRRPGPAGVGRASTRTCSGPLRGGGGNFGVVTEFEFRLHEVGPIVHFGLFFFWPDQGRATLFRFARDFVTA